MDPGGGGAMVLEDFGQRVDLTRHIGKVLANYTEGTTVLQELIQNADNTDTARIRLCLDRLARGGIAAGPHARAMAWPSAARLQ
jgi:sacsin